MEGSEKHLAKCVVFCSGFVILFIWLFKCPFYENISYTLLKAYLHLIVCVDVFKPHAKELFVLINLTFIKRVLSKTF